jgi:anion-transporting  ArsA/GET3 family ATPase
MEEGFRTRAEHMRRLLARRTTAFVLVTSPRSDTVDEAGWFADKLNESGLAVEGLVVNRVHPPFVTREPLPVAPPGSALDALVGNLRGYQAVNRREERAFAALVTQVAPSPVSLVPLLDVDVHDLHGLGLVADCLFADQVGTR